MDTEAVLAALQRIEKRADRAADDREVIATYVDEPSLVSALTASDNGVVFGRRGTGKTHALRYLAELERQRGNFVVYVDADKSLGSTEGLYADSSLPVSERATRLLIDVLGVVHTALLEDAFRLDYSPLITTLEQMLDHMREVLVVEEAETEISAETEAETSRQRVAGARLTTDSLLVIDWQRQSSASERELSGSRMKVTGSIRHRVHFGGVAESLRDALTAHPARRCWLLVDEWSSLPRDLQPYLAEMMRRTFFALPKVTVRIAAIPHRTAWRAPASQSGYVGLEMGADIFPLLDLDDFVVFPARSRAEQVERSSTFFKTLLYRHINQELLAAQLEPLDDPDQLVRLMFTQVTALHELIRAAEGVPRDALTIAARAALRAGSRSISTEHVREAASQVYSATKAAAVQASPNARELLEAIINEVISKKKARAFLLSPEDADHPIIQQLVDDRVLHVIKRGYSSKGEPGERFDVLQIDYGCYVQLLRTGSAPEGMFANLDAGDDSAFRALYDGGEVPEDDYRAIRRAVLKLPEIMSQIRAGAEPDIGDAGSSR